MNLLGPVLEERFRLLEDNGEDWSEKPVSRYLTLTRTIAKVSFKVDMISWLLEEAPENERRSIRELTNRMLLVNFAAIHTSSNVSRILRHVL